MDSKPKKYLFDNNDFDEEVIRARARAQAEAKRRPTFSQEEMEASRQTGFTQGRQEGVRETMSGLEAQLAELAQHIHTSLGLFTAQEEARTALFVEQASTLAATILQKSMPALLEKMSLPQMTDFLSDILSQHVKKNNLLIYVPTRYADALNEKIQELASKSEHGHTWQVKPSDTLSNYECHIEWDGGGARYDGQTIANVALNALMAQIAPIDESVQNPHNETDTHQDISHDTATDEVTP